MRYRLAYVLVAIALLFVVLAPSPTLGQGKGKKGGFGQGGFGPGGFGQGGFGPDGFNSDGGFGGPGGFGGKGGKGGGKKKGPGGFGPGGFGQGAFTGQGGFASQGGFQGGLGGPGRGNPLDSINQMAESDFNMRDRNGDGFLNQDEMPTQLRAELGKWDTNHDNLISIDEYKFFYATNMQNRGRASQFDSFATIIIEEEDLDTRPDVWRAGKLPKELPSWFKELDTDRDGQVALYEWRRGGKDIDEFSDWDRNNDGYITPEEALSKQRLTLLASAAEAGDSAGPMMKKSPKFMSTGGEGFSGKKNRDGFGGGKKKGDGFAKLKSVE